MTVMTEEEADELAAQIRSHGHMPLPLSGWGRRSIWGWDRRDGTYYAQLWRDGEEQDEPTLWLHPVNIQGWHGAILDLRVLAKVLIVATGCTAREVYRAMAAFAPPALRPVLLAEIEDQPNTRAK